MRRDIRNEIWTAAVLVLLLAAVGLSAVLLTTVNETEQATGTPVEIISNVNDSTLTLEPTPTATSSATRTATYTRTPPAATRTATHTPTRRTVTATMSATATQTPTPRPTTRPPTQTPSPTASQTPQPTTTPADTVPPLSKDTLTPARRPSRTPTPTPTPTKTPIPLAVMTTAPCIAPPDWTTYTVQPGNTLFSIARAVGSTVGELRVVNCIADADNIGVGDALAVPRAPTGPVRTGVPQLPDEVPGVAYRVEGCSVPASVISSPAPGARLGGLFTVTGTAALENFQYYRLEVRPDFTNIYNFYARSEQPVVNGALGQVNAELFDDGLYWVRLTVVDNTGNFIEPCAIPVIFE